MVLRPICEKKFRYLAKSLQVHVMTLYINEYLPFRYTRFTFRNIESSRATPHELQYWCRSRTKQPLHFAYKVSDAIAHDFLSQKVKKVADLLASYSNAPESDTVLQSRAFCRQGRGQSVAENLRENQDCSYRPLICCCTKHL